MTEKRSTTRGLPFSRLALSQRMRFGVLVSLTLFAVLFLGLALWRGHRAPESAEFRGESSSAPARYALPAAGGVPSPTASFSMGERGETLREEEFSFPRWPSLREYQDEARQQPHGTPVVLRQFVRGVAPAIGRALEAQASPEFQQRTLAFLLDCATQSQEAAPVSLRAYCWSAAQNLVDAHPDRLALRALRDGAAPRVGSDALALAAPLDPKR